MVQEAGQVVGPRPEVGLLEDLGVAEGDRDLRGEQLDELELLLVEAGRVAQPLERHHAAAPSGPSSGTTIRLPSIAPVPGSG